MPKHNTLKTETRVLGELDEAIKSSVKRNGGRGIRLRCGAFNLASATRCVKGTGSGKADFVIGGQAVDDEKLFISHKAEGAAGLPKLAGSVAHAYRRLWATERKTLPDVDVAATAGGKPSMMRNSLSLTRLRGFPIMVMGPVALRHFQAGVRFIVSGRGTLCSGLLSTVAETQNMGCTSNIMAYLDGPDAIGECGASHRKR